MEALLFGLPERPTRKIMDKLSFLDLHRLSLVSKRFKEFVRNYTKDLDVAIDVNFTSIRSIIVGQRYPDLQVRGKCQWLFYSPRHQEVPELTENTHNTMNIICAPSEERVVAVVKYLLEILPTATLRHVEVRLKHVDMMEPILNATCLWRCRSLRLTAGSLNGEEFNRFMRDFQRTELLLDCNPGSNFVLNQQVRCNIVQIMNCHWLTVSSLLNFKTEKLYLNLPNFSNADYNAYITNWFYGDDETLEILEVYQQFDALDDSRILEGLPALPGRRKRPGLFSSLRPDLPFERGFDLRRPSDGRLATLLMWEETYKQFMHFVVWRVLDPNFPVHV